MTIYASESSKNLRKICNECSELERSELFLYRVIKLRMNWKLHIPIQSLEGSLRKEGTLK